ncbi:MAG: hypothetical protein KC964_16960, partial [Candidatus Omnitrophica bacterium]|nr:hypothetical protein [Candidatus Omnitrophota bacterium]
TCLKGWFGGEAYPSDTMGDPVLIETETGNFQAGYPIGLQTNRHNIRLVDSPDTVNVWALGDFGLGLKYAASSTAIVVTTPSVPDGRVGENYSAQLESANGLPPLNWRICGGALPPGLTLQPDGQILGTPTASATFRFVAAVFDSEGESAGKKFSLRIEPALSPTILTETLPDGIVGQDYGAILEATGTVEPYEWALISAGLSPGLAFMGYGAIGGIPETPGDFTFEVYVTDSQVPYGSARKELNLHIKGSFAEAPGPCDEFPLFCLALNWKKPAPVVGGDFDGDGEVDCNDALVAIRAMRH